LIDINSAQIRRLLGLDQLGEITALLIRLENHMATAREQLDNLSGKVDDIMADVRAFRDATEANREQLSPDAQEAYDRLSAKVDAFNTEVGDADGSDTVPGDDTDVTGGGTDVTGGGADDTTPGAGV
jgi:outer membrane murein-binding lipoprotein Lpp